MTSVNKLTLYQLLSRESQAINTARPIIQGPGVVSVSERDVCVRWLTQLQWMNCQVDTYALAVVLLDRVLGARRVQCKYVPCVALACLYLACKLCEEPECVMSICELVRVSGGVYSARELLRMESVVLSTLEWRLAQPTLVDFIHELLGAEEEWSVSLESHVLQVLCDHRVMSFPASVVATSVLSLRMLVPWVSVATEQLNRCTALCKLVLLDSVVPSLISSPRKRRRQHSNGSCCSAEVDDDISDAVHMLYEHNILSIPTAA